MASQSSHLKKSLFFHMKNALSPPFYLPTNLFSFSSKLNLTSLWCQPPQTPSICPRFTALPSQSDPSPAEVPQALAVGFQEVETSNRLQWVRAQILSSFFSRFVANHTQLSPHLSSAVSVAQLSSAAQRCAVPYCAVLCFLFCTQVMTRKYQVPGYVRTYNHKKAQPAELS